MEVVLELINERIAKHASVTRLVNFRQLAYAKTTTKASAMPLARAYKK